MIFMLTPWFHEIETRPRADLLLRVSVSPIALLAAPASLIILFGMMIFCVRKDPSSAGTKVLWFILFFTTACFGAVVYFFKVYMKQTQASVFLPAVTATSTTQDSNDGR